MKPRFALSLTDTEITLLHRGKGGWSILGTASPENPEFATELAQLRETADKTEPGQQFSKLILPADQILYTVLPLSTSDPQTQRAEIDRGLEGLTPYLVDQLIYDYRLRKDGTAQVAVVARETLQVAEAFAVENGFQPVSFVAVPPEGAYSGEPWFGTTQAASDLLGPEELVERDRFPARVTAPKPQKTAAPKQELQIGPLPPPDTRPSFASQRRQNPAPKPRSAKPPEPASGPEPRLTLAKTAQPSAPQGPATVITSAIAAPPGAARRDAPSSRHSLPTEKAAPRAPAIAVTPRMALGAGVAAILVLGIGLWMALPSDTPAPGSPTERADVGASAPQTAPRLPSPQPAPPSKPGLSTEDVTELVEELGVLPVPPLQPLRPAENSLDRLYIASIDPAIPGEDAVALPDQTALLDDQLPQFFFVPPQGHVFDLDERGLVTPSRAGTLSPQGHYVFAGRPALVPPVRRALEPETAPTPQDLQTAQDNDPLYQRLAAFRPKQRPGNLDERMERSQRGGLTEAELAAIRPRARPVSDQQVALANVAAAAPNAAPVANATPSLIPPPRPAGFTAAAIARAVQDAQTPAPPVSAPAANTPRQIPSAASVAKQATLKNAVNLGRINLFGVFGSAGDRRALVRLSSGRYIKVEIGDRLDGGRVVAIGEDDLSYKKNGKTIRLEIPRG